MTDHFVTGATGFIGRRLVKKLLADGQSRVWFLVPQRELDKLDALHRYWGVGPDRATPVTGDLTQPGLGVAEDIAAQLRGRVAHLFHLAAIYDLKADARAQQAANVDGTRHAVRFAEQIEAGCFHHVSSIAAAGLYEGVFREDMFEEAEHLDNPYFRTKHDAEGVVRGECARPWRIYRPGIVVGQSDTGEMDKIDGPYYFFKLIQRLRGALPQWVPLIGIEGGRLNLVPVDFVVAALDHIARQPGLDGRCFHLTDPSPHRVGDVLDIFAKAAHAPRVSLRINAKLLDLVPLALRRGLSMLAPVRRVRDLAMRELGLPPDFLRLVNYPTRFDSRDAQKALAGSGISVPPLQTYAWKLWDYWERHLDPDLFIDRSLGGTVRDRVMMITGAGAGIGRATALKVAAAGARLVAVDLDEERLARLRETVEAAGGRIATYRCDLSELDQVDELVQKVLSEHGGVDILLNNAGRSIRRSIENSFERFHDFQRTMQLNYFGALRLTLGLLPSMAARRRGHVINISSIGVLTNAPRFSAYVASKAAMDAFTRCAASEFADTGVEFTTVNMPLVRTDMTAPTEIYRQMPLLSPDEAADMVIEAIVTRPVRLATRLGIFAEVLHAVAPKVAHVVMNTAYRMFPESRAAQGARQGPPELTPDQAALAQLMRGVHW